MRGTRRLKLAGGLCILAGFILLMALWLSWDRLWPRYLLWRDFRRLGTNPQGHLEYLHQPSGIVFVRLPGGEFLMGTPEEERETILRDEAPGDRKQVERALSSEGPCHRVVLSPFLIAKYEVTRSQWKKVMDGEKDSSGSEDLPRGGVSWLDCGEFCRRVSLSLPSEAQWEYACRAGTSGSFGGTGTLRDMGWSGGDEGGELEVGQTARRGGTKMPNAFGIFDMHGNMEEWCRDSLDEGFYSSEEAAAADPFCRKPSKYRIAKGGSFQVVDWCCRSGRRGWLEPGAKWSYLGFRPVLNLRDPGFAE